MTYGSDPIINSLWVQFGEALRRAQRVLVLGHSLNDAAILEALRANVQPLDRIAVTVLGSRVNAEEPDESAVPVLETIRSHLGNAAFIPIRFGEEADSGTKGLGVWLQRDFES